jgi:aspartate--ammonia ligase
METMYTGSLYITIEKILPEEIFFVTTQELEDRYPESTVV